MDSQNRTFFSKKNNRRFSKEEAFARNQQTPLVEIALDSISISNNTILSDINLTVYKKDFLFVTGATGAGKSTLLNIISGDGAHYKMQGDFKLNQKSSGSCTFISKVFQDLKVFGEISLLDNLVFSCDQSVYNSDQEFLNDVDNYLKVFGIYDKKHSKLKNTNRGVHQKIAIIRAILSRPDILVADEPTSALDFKSSMKVYDILSHLNLKTGLTVIWATHSRDLIKNLNGKVIHIESGRISYSGKACFI